MTPSQPAADHFRSGLPYNGLGRGPRPLVVVQGLTFENKPQSGLATSMYRGMGHPASGRQFRRDMLAFLRED